MTEVTLLKHGTQWAGFEVRGHSGYAESGSDIVCSAISALTQTAAQGMEELLKLELTLDISDGRLKCILPGMNEKTRAQAELLLATMELGLRSIAETYGDYINIRERTV